MGWKAQLAGWALLATGLAAQQNGALSSSGLHGPSDQASAAGDQPLTDNSSSVSTLAQPEVVRQPSNHFIAKWQAKILPEGLSSLAAIPLVIPLFEGRVPWKCRVDHIFGDGNVDYRVEPGDVLSAPDTGAGIPDDCRVTIRLEGYEYAEVTLHQQALVVLKRIGAHEGSTVSAPSLDVPEEARKAWERGIEEINKEKWDKARKDLEGPSRSTRTMRLRGRILARSTRNNLRRRKRAPHTNMPCRPIRNMCVRMYRPPGWPWMKAAWTMGCG